MSLPLTKRLRLKIQPFVADLILTAAYFLVIQIFVQDKNSAFRNKGVFLNGIFSLQVINKGNRKETFANIIHRKSQNIML